MPRFHVCIAAMALSGCAGGQLAELEEEQDALRTEYEDLQANVEALKSEMVALGLITEAQANARKAPTPKPTKAKGGKAGPRKPRSWNTTVTLTLGEPVPAEDVRAELLYERVHAMWKAGGPP